MISRFYFPAAPLDNFVSSLYFYEGFNPEHSIDCFLPNGETEMIIDLTDDPKYIYDRESLKEIQACNKVWVSGVRTEPICIPSGKDSRMMIVNFKKGGGRPFYPLPLYEITDYVLDADLLFGSRIAELRNRMKETSSVDLMFRLVENFLLNESGNQIFPDIKDRCVTYFIQELISSPNKWTLENLSSKVGYSQKHLISIFHERVGVTPKMYMRLLRFQQVIRQIEIVGDQDWIQVAHSCGYYDQSHFIRDFKTFSGYTPGEYLHRKNDVLNYVPLR